MEIVLLKSSICLLAFIAFYKVFLERTSNHQFKRIYLLGVVLVSITIPFITFIEYIEPQNALTNISEVTGFSKSQNPITKESLNYLPIVLWSIYGIGVLLFLIRFVYNLSQIALKIRRNPKQKTNGFIRVLLKDLIIPHTFFSYIFFNKTKFENNQIPKEVLLHEQTHAKQKHSLDILFIEVSQIIFWFHPLVYILKKDIKLNHEFLADQAVINQGIESTNYQKILLSFSSNQQALTLEHAINYSSIKKRFTVMKTQTSKQTFWLRSLLLLPLLAILIFSFSTTKQVEKETKLQSEIKTETPKLVILENPLQLLLNGAPTNLKNLKNDFTKITKGEASDLIIDVTHTEEIAYPFVSKIKNTLKGELKTIHLAGAYYSVDKESNEISIHKKKQDKATPEQIVEYNKLAKHYNATINDVGYSIKMSDLERIEHLYSIMTDEQKKHAEPYPNFPPIPPNPPKVKKGEASLIPPPPPPVPSNATPEQKAKYQKIHEEYNKKYTIENGEVREQIPPPPPPPKTPLDHVIEMAKKDADFYYEGKKITSDEAIEIVKNDDELSISTQTKNVERPMVNITTHPVITDDKGKVITKVETLQDVKSNTQKDKNGYVEINGTTYFYIIKNKKITYFNRYGKKVNEKGALLN